MSKPSWDALADRYGALPAAYNADVEPDEDICEFCGAATAEACHCADTERAYALAHPQREAGAAGDGQATVLAALGNWLAFVIACALVAGCVYGAQWADMLWLAPFAGR